MGRSTVMSRDDFTWSMMCRSGVVGGLTSLTTVWRLNVVVEFSVVLLPVGDVTWSVMCSSGVVGGLTSTMVSAWLLNVEVEWFGVLPVDGIDSGINSWTVGAFAQVMWARLRFISCLLTYLITCPSVLLFRCLHPVAKV